MPTPTLTKEELKHLVRGGKPLGSGLTGEAFLVRLQTGRKAVLKRCSDRRFDFVFRNECRILRELRRSGLVPRLLGKSRKPWALLMEHCEGRTGQDLLDDPVSRKETLVRVVRQLANQVGELHKQGYAHNDVKLDNCVVDTSSRPLAVRLIDFGHSVRLGRSGGYDVIPEGAHLAPELSKGGKASPSTDVFSLGHVLDWVMGQVGREFFPKVFHRLAAHALSADPKRRPSPQLFVEAMDHGLAKMRNGVGRR